MQIDGSAFVITGAASRFGAAVARMIVDEGGRVGLIDLDEAAGKKLEAELGDSDLFLKTDVAAPVEIQRGIDMCAAHFGGIDGAVCCAAARDEPRPDETSVAGLARFADAVNVGLAGAFTVGQLAAQAIGRRDLDEDSERGVIVLSALLSVGETSAGLATRAAGKSTRRLRLAHPTSLRAPSLRRRRRALLVRPSSRASCGTFAKIV